MIDLKKLSRKKADRAPASMLDLFEQLDRRATHASLRPLQIEALQKLQALIESKDVVLRASTGSGKTLIGLVFAEYMRRKYQGEPVIFVCPTNQLVEQVADSARAIGVPFECYSTNAYPYAALAGGAIVGCAYETVFNAIARLGKNNVVPAGMVLDDVHAGIDRVRSSYTLTLPPEHYPAIRTLLSRACEKSDASVWHGINNSEAHAKYDVPYWVVKTVMPQIVERFQQCAQSDAVKFEWGNVDRYAEFLRVCVNASSIEVSLNVPPVEENSVFSGARHRLFMSASIKDGAALIKDLACDPSAIQSLVELDSDKGAGERLVLPVSLISASIKREDVAKLCKDLSKQVNVVVLTSSIAQAALWTSAGATLRSGKEVEQGVATLRQGSKGGFVVFAQRFDGVDLPDDSCRVLVVDGVPVGDRLCDQIDAERQKNSPGYNARTVNRIEQALGRAVRSYADYAAVLLVGSDIASFVGRKDARALFDPVTRAQIDLGADIAGQLSSESGYLGGIRSAIELVLSRDSDWKEAHRERISQAEKQKRKGNSMSDLEQVAVVERSAWVKVKGRSFQAGASLLQEAADISGLHPAVKAELLVKRASYMSEFDPGAALDVYRAAFHLNPTFARPPQLQERKYGRIGTQAANAGGMFQSFASANGVVARLADIRGRLAFGQPPSVVEQALKDLGEMLGAASSRPEQETGRGPDVLWIFDQYVLCIEAKSEKKAPFSKSDAGQLLMSWKWALNSTGVAESDVVPVFVSSINRAERAEDVAYGPRLISEDLCARLCDKLAEVAVAIVYDGPLFSDAKALARLFANAELRDVDIVKALGQVGASKQ